MDAFGELYRRHNRRVYFLCLRMTGNTAEAEDLTQETFVQLFHTVGSFRGASSFTTWLHRIAVNNVLMHFRRVSLRPEKSIEEGDTPDRAQPGAQNLTASAVLNRVELDRAVAQLAPGYRVVFVLHDVEGYQHNEIAELLGYTIHTSKSQLHKARLKLRELLLRQRN